MLGIGSQQSVDSSQEFEQDPQDFYDGLPQASQDLWDAIAAKGWTPGHVDGLGFVAFIEGEPELGPFEKISDLWAEVDGSEVTEEEPEAELAADDADETDEDGSEEEVLATNEHEEDTNQERTSVVYCGTPSPKDDGSFCRLDLGHEGACSMVEPEPSVEVELDEDHKGNSYLPGVKPVVDQQIADAAGKYFADNTDWKDAGKRRTDSKNALDAIVAIKKHLFHEDPDNTRSLIYKAGGLTIRIAKESKTIVSVETEKETVAKGPKKGKRK